VVLTFLTSHYYYKTVNTRRHRLKQPKFVLRCTQLQVGLPHAIGISDVSYISINGYPNYLCQKKKPPQTGRELAHSLVPYRTSPNRRW